MKTFKYFSEVAQDALNPLFPYGGSSYGPGMGQYEPIADLNADAKKQVKKSDLDQIERYADRVFAAVGIDVEFTRHFLDRVNDARNVKQITPSELTRLFKQSFKKYGKKISKLGDDAQAVINDMKTNINVPFVLNKTRGGELELVAKTVMRKKNFSTSNTKLSFESYTELEEMQFFTHDVAEQITLPSPPTDDKAEIVKLKKMMNARTPEDEQSVKDHDEVPFYAIKVYCEKNKLIFHKDEFNDIIEQSIPIILHFKDRFDRKRPKDVDDSIETLNSKTNKTPSYPSGHSAQSMLVAKYVIGKFPKHEKGLIAAAKECGIGRVLAGFHYLSDHVAGKLLGEKMYSIMNKDDYNA
tara:strand:- start:2800 stop:3861 length:1062 start_codon:yes stop_codon:yes gene_type:complete